MKQRSLRVRFLIDGLAKIVGVLVLSALLIVLAVIFIYIYLGAAQGFRLEMVLTTGNTTSGGLLNALVGTMLLTGLAVSIASVLGVFTAIDLSAYAGRALASVLRTGIDTMAAVPSIVLGLFGYLVFVMWFHMGFSLLAGSLTLSLMMVPYVARSGEQSMSAVEREVVHAAYALGASKWQVVTRILLKYARPGIVSSVLLAASIGAGETAQLIYTAGWNPGFPSGLTGSQVGYLTYVIWAGINQPSAYSHALAFVSSALLVTMVIGLLIASRKLLQVKS
jgi:phosphate transport system permease protein